MHFKNVAQGIDLERVVHPKEGQKLRVPVHISRASMEITAPAGAAVYLDGKLQGKAPVGKLQFFEGHHSIKVKMGGATFDKTFTAQAGQELTLEVHPTSE